MAGCNVKAVFLFFLGLFLGACARPVGPPTVVQLQSHEIDAASLADKTVALVAATEGGHRPFCSGVWVSPKEILTANHCVDKQELGDQEWFFVRSDVYGKQASMRPRSARLYAVDADHDLALLRVANPPPHEVASLSTSNIRAGAFAQSMGHSLGLLWSYSAGYVAAARQMDVTGRDLLWLQAAVPISPGNSGGGLFDENGALIGLAHATYSSPRAQLLNMFVHRDYIYAFLHEAER